MPRPQFDEAQATAIALDKFGIRAQAVMKLDSVRCVQLVACHACLAVILHAVAHGLLLLLHPYMHSPRVPILIRSGFEREQYDDQNFLLRMGGPPDGSADFVLKISNTDFGTDVLDLQNCAMLLSAQHDLPVPVPQPCLCDGTAGGASSDRYIAAVEGTGDWGEGTMFDTRVISFLPGVLLAKAPHTEGLMHALGGCVAKMDIAMQNFRHHAAWKRDLDWDLANFPRARRYLGEVHGDARRELAELYLHRFDTMALPALHLLPRQIIHNDFNDYNIVVQGDKVTGVFDFGDMVCTHTVNDIAICIAYCILGKEGDDGDPIGVAAQLVAGYNAVRRLSSLELEVLFVLVTTRLAQSVLMSAHSRRLDPDNEYLAVTEAPAWAMLERLRREDPCAVTAVFRTACGLSAATPTDRLVTRLLHLRVRGGVGPILRLESGRELVSASSSESEATVQMFDFSGASAGIYTPEVLADAGTFEAVLLRTLKERNAEVGWGAYDEERIIYTSDSYETQGAGSERRTVHLGIDLFVPVDTPVICPLPNTTVHSFANNSKRLDYGPCIVLRHELEIDGKSDDLGEDLNVFYTLYGHLSEKSLDGLEIGAKVERGQQFAEVGAYPINGDWPPHLHFQIITDMLGKHGDFDGVCAASERARFTQLCPNPNVLLGVAFDRLFPEHVGM